MQELDFKLTVDEANLILEALGQMPFAKVYQLVAKLQSQANEQLGQASPELSAADAEPQTPASVAVGGKTDGE